jgi:alkanesulfonate monooxygenase SsuD/methylene tetrahydromethanopterin reductase-like flavin-dependent oxidoreductase (luciferase family)
MDIGIGLPNPIPGTPGHTLVEWARVAERLGFRTLATIDRIAYPSYDSLIALAAAGVATESIELMTNVVLGPTRKPVVLAKEAAGVDQLSGGRLTLGVGIGTREDDYAAVGLPFTGRGRRWDDDLEIIHRAWAGELVEGAKKPVAPTPVRETIPILGGGTSDQAIARAVKWGIGWTAGGAGPDRAGQVAQRVREAWRAAGRDGEPRIVCLQYFALGDGAGQGALAYLSDYYGDFGPRIAQGLPTTPDEVREVTKRFEAVGADELIFDPTVAELNQVELLAEAVL